MSYRPTPIPILAGVDPALERYLREELELIANSLFNLSTYQVGLQAQTQEPKTPVDGTLVYADGVQWNPGAGQGLYVYFNSAWRKVTTA